MLVVPGGVYQDVPEGIVDYDDRPVGILVGAFIGLGFPAW